MNSLQIWIESIVCICVLFWIHNNNNNNMVERYEEKKKTKSGVIKYVWLEISFTHINGAKNCRRKGMWFFFMSIWMKYGQKLIIFLILFWLLSLKYVSLSLKKSLCLLSKILSRRSNPKIQTVNIKM
jgi:hypothetical protein